MKEVRLDEICVVIAGQSPPSDSYNQDKNGVPFFQGKADFGSMYPTVRYWCNKPTKMSIPNDILFSVRAPVGPTNINNIEACIGRGLSALRCKEDVLEMKYLLHYLRANENKISDLGTGSTFKAITISELKKLQIPLPPLPQQQKIANILDAADALRQNDKALIAKYDELTQALFLDMFGDPVSNPKGWEKKRVYQISKFLFAGGDVPKDNFSKELNEKYNVPIYSNGLGENALYGFTNINKVKEDSITMSARGTIGFPEIRKTPFFPIIRLIVITPFTEVVLLNYLKIALSFLEFKKGGSSIPQLTVPMIKDKEILIPPIDLQNQFAERVAVIEEQKAIAQKSIEKSESLFNSLLQKAFKGELV